MRQLIVKAPRGQGQEVLDMARKHDGMNLVQMDATEGGDAWDLVLIHASNRQIGPLISDLEPLQDLQVTLVPNSVFPMSSPSSVVADQIRNVQARSPLEVWLNGIQSIGTWKGFLGYAVAAAIVVWIGLFTNTSYLLVGAMLIAPFAGPAMNLALGTATGDSLLVWRNVVRYFTALAVTILITWLISILFAQSVATSSMVATSEISSVAVLLPLVAGAAGALNLSQAESSSLVTGAATGLLISASLAPPAGLIGMAAAIGRWDMALSGVFLLLLQLVGINLAGSLVFRLFGLNPSVTRYDPGKAYIFYASLALTMVALAGLLFWQFSSAPDFQRSTRAQQAVGEVQKVVSESELATLVEANLRFTRPSVEDQNTLLGVVYVQRRPGVTGSDEDIRQALTQAIQERLLEQGFNVKPLINVNVLEPPAGQP